MTVHCLLLGLLNSAWWHRTWCRLFFIGWGTPSSTKGHRWVRGLSSARLHTLSATTTDTLLFLLVFISWVVGITTATIEESGVLTSGGGEQPEWQGISGISYHQPGSADSGWSDCSRCFPARCEGPNLSVGVFIEVCLLAYLLTYLATLGQATRRCRALCRQQGR